MTLKTLKDLNWEDYRTFTQEAVSKKELKAEAVKWVKDIEKKNPNPYGDSSMVYWIKHFFNLTEEDLK